MKRFIALLCLAACGPVEPMEADPSASTAQPIIGGNVRSDVTYGGALVESPTATCSGGFVARDVVLTHRRCIDATRVWVGGQKYAVRLGRAVPFNGELAAVQLRQLVPSTVAILQASTQQAVAGESLSCFGFDASRTFTSGVFQVTDVTADAFFMRGGVGFSGTFGIDTSDEGGFCIRDGSYELVGTLARVKGTTPRAVHVAQLTAWLKNVMVAVEQSRSQVSLTLVNDPNLVTPLALTLDGTLKSSFRVAKSLKQAFYLAPAQAGRPEIVALVNADTGTCVSVPTGLPAATMARCSFTSASQRFVLTSRSNAYPSGMTDGYQLESMNAPGFCLTPQSAGLLVPCVPALATFAFWLNLF